MSHYFNFVFLYFDLFSDSNEEIDTRLLVFHCLRGDTSNHVILLKQDKYALFFLIPGILYYSRHLYVVLDVKQKANHLNLYRQEKDSIAF